MTTRFNATFEPLESRTHLSASQGGERDGDDGHGRGDRPDRTPAVYAPHATVRGATLGAWAAEWWKWATSAPAAVNPLQDPTGAHAGVGQSKHVFFLAGRRGTGVVERTITAPSGSRFFFPVLNTTFITFPEDPPAPVAELRQLVGSAVDAYSGLYATVDGRSIDVTPHREVDPYPGGFELTLPADNIFGRPAGTYGPVVTDGYWLMLKPLPVGRHTITFGGTFRPGRTLDVTYHVEVVPKGQYRKDEPAAPPRDCGRADGGAVRHVREELLA
jgi:hypothetical protein